MEGKRANLQKSLRKRGQGASGTFVEKATLALEENDDEAFKRRRGGDRRKSMLVSRAANRGRFSLGRWSEFGRWCDIFSGSDTHGVCECPIKM